MLARTVHIFEVGPRDGLQNERVLLPLNKKLQFISGLIQAGVQDLEVGAFVRPDRVPQMADTAEIFNRINARKFSIGRARLWSLVPNLRGLERATSVGVKNIAVFTAATESFTRRNIGMTISESLAEFGKVIRQAKGMKVRGYVSTAFGCPFEGKVSPKKALKVIEKLAMLGVDQISIGDTIGVATPRDITPVIQQALKDFGPERVAVHFHDTRGTALANTLRALELGVKIIDSSAGGLGGCPFAPGASGNLATEDLLYMLQGMGIRTGIDLNKLCKVSLKLSKEMGRPLSSRYLAAFASQHK